jgi:hypothetical protein
MGRQALKYGTALIALQIAVANASGLGRLFTTGAAGGTQLVKGLQGR